jgi:hypothetical protein
VFTLKIEKGSVSCGRPKHALRRHGHAYDWRIYPLPGDRAQGVGGSTWKIPAAGSGKT